MASFLTNLMEKVGLLSPDEPSAEAVVLEIVAEETGVPVAPTPVVLPEPETPTRPLSKRMTLKELLVGTVSADAHAQEAALAKDVGLDVAWKTIFETAGITVPKHGWTVERALGFLRKVSASGISPVEARKALEEALVADGADVREVARDAVAKDEILDVYERELDTNVSQYLAELGGEIEEMEARITDLRSRIAEVEEERAGTTRRLTAWKSEKRHLEQQWAKVLHILAPLM